MEKPIGTEYAGPSGVGRDSSWLTAEDLVEGRDVEVTIEKVVLFPKVTFQGGRTRANMLGLQFAGKDRVLGLNATNRRVLNKSFGNIARAWKGKKVTLYVTETQLAGETVKCVRIRDRGSRAASAAEEFLAVEHEDPAAAQGLPDDSGGASATWGPVDAAPAAVQSGDGKSDLDVWSDFHALAFKVEKSFNGERQIIKEAPKKGSGQWYLTDPAVGEPSTRLYDGIGIRLTVPREQLAQYAAKLEELLS